MDPSTECQDQHTQITMSWSPAYPQYPAASSTRTSVPNFESHLKNLNRFHKGLNAELLLTIDEFEKAHSITNALDNSIEWRLRNHLNRKLNQSVKFPLLVRNAEASKIQSFFIANETLLSSKMEQYFHKMVKIDSMYDAIGKAIRNEFSHEHEPYFDDCFLQAEVFAIEGILQRSKEVGITGYLTNETEGVKDGLCTIIYIQSYLNNLENMIEESMIELANKADQLRLNENFPMEDALFELSTLMQYRLATMVNNFFLNITKVTKNSSAGLSYIQTIFSEKLPKSTSPFDWESKDLAYFARELYNYQYPKPIKVQEGKYLPIGSTAFSKAGWENREAVAIMFFQKYIIPYKEQTISTKALMTIVHFAEIIALCADNPFQICSHIKRCKLALAYSIRAKKVAQLELQGEIPLPPPPPPPTPPPPPPPPPP
ncbi:hypothetical protein BC937DRAFT_91289, partial [Endogone sp. FLAS-F59071]